MLNFYISVESQIILKHDREHVTTYIKRSNKFKKINYINADCQKLDKNDYKSDLILLRKIAKKFKNKKFFDEIYFVFIKRT